MTFGGDHAAEGSAKAALQLLATIYDRTKEIFWVLDKNPAVASVTHGCSAGRSNDVMTGQEECYFEIYVDATTRTDEAFCWRVDVVSNANGWELDRVISTPIGQRDVDVRFQEVTFKKFDELSASYLALMDELVESARTFDFGNPYASASGSKSS